MENIKFVYTENGKEKSSLDEHRRRCEIMEHNQRLQKEYPVYKEKYNHISSQKNGILLEKETEQKFDVQIWDSTDFIIDNLKEKLKNN